MTSEAIRLCSGTVNQCIQAQYPIKVPRCGKEMAFFGKNVTDLTFTKVFIPTFPKSRYMTHIVDSLRKHQKMIVLGAALAVITLYVIPVDQIATALTPSERVNQLFSFHIQALSDSVR